jgi:two-component system nitrogen regulation sensor histidine kinase NtrY
MKRAPANMSLLWKILLSTSLAITLLFAVIGWIVQDQFVRIAASTAEEEVRASFQAYDSLWKARAEQLASVSLVLSRMPDVRAAFSTRDQATIRDTAGEVWDKISHRGAVFIVTDPRGVVLAALGAASRFNIQRFPAVEIAAKSFPAQAMGFVVHDGQLYQMVMTPVYVAATSGSALLNVLVAGIEVDAQMAGELKSATGGSEFVFLAGGEVMASTLKGGVADDGREYNRFSTPLLDIGGQPIGELRILRSFDAARNRIASVRNRIIGLWALAVLAGLLMTYALARRLLRPVQALDAAAAEIGKGNYDVEVKVESDDEIGRLARTFNSMCASIRSAREELIRRERISTIARMSTSIVHDLRNPLASIYGGAEMLVDDDLSPSQVKRLAANIYRASRRVQELLQELTDARRGRSHARETCRLAEVIGAALGALEADAARHHVEVRVEVEDSLELPLDRSPMERVFQNLVGNAIEAMPSGGAVRITAKPNGKDVLIAVEDTGPGIPRSISDHLFQPFVSAGKKNGIGLGLALSRETVLDHGGDLWADLSVPSGARFVLRLPLHDPARDHA